MSHSRNMDWFESRMNEFHKNKSRKALEADREKAKFEMPERHKPNYFVAIKVSDDQIHQTLKDLQQHILEKDSQLKNSMIELATLHVTLMVMYIGDAKTHRKAMKALKDIHKECDDDLSNNPLKLEFRGLGHFRRRILYAKLEDDSYSRLCSLADIVKKHFAAASIFTTDKRESFNPHLTVAKIREDKERRNNIDPALYEDFNDRYFGFQNVKSIQLLKMHGARDENGYYTGHEIFFSAFEPTI